MTGKINLYNHLFLCTNHSLTVWLASTKCLNTGQKTLLGLILSGTLRNANWIQPYYSGVRLISHAST